MWSPTLLVLEERMQVWYLEIKSKNFCIVLSSPSGAGKTSISKKLLQKDRKLALSISCTTRPRRKGEVNKKDYIFMSEEEFKKQIPGVIVSRPKAAIYFIIDLKNVVGVTFDAIDFTNYCAEEGRVKIGQNDYTLLLAPMSGFYSNKKLGRKQLRVAIVEDFKLIIKAPKILSKLLNSYALKRNF